VWELVKLTPFPWPTCLGDSKSKRAAELAPRGCWIWGRPRRQCRPTRAAEPAPRGCSGLLSLHRGAAELGGGQGGVVKPHGAAELGGGQGGVVDLHGLLSLHHGAAELAPRGC
jgi:hypothetical protein